jgi:hypothetical protein
MVSLSHQDEDARLIREMRAVRVVDCVTRDTHNIYKKDDVGSMPVVIARTEMMEDNGWAFDLAQSRH